jgi:hypothetical protein
VACSSSPIPVRPDRALRPLDLKRNERLRSDGTVSISDLFQTDGFGSNGAEEGEGDLTVRLGFPSPAMRSGTGIGRRRASSDRRRWGIRRRRSEEDGGLVCLVGFDACILKRHRGVAGDERNAGELRLRTVARIYCAI